MRRLIFVPGFVLLLFSAVISGFPNEGAAVAENRQREFAAAVEHLLTIGMERGETAYKEAEHYWSQQQARFPKAAPLYYAWGLVLRHHSRNADAERVFLASAKLSRPPFYRAWQAGIWMKLSREDYSGGLRQLELLTATLARETSRRAPSTDEEAAAHWLGRALAALNHVPLSGKEKAKLTSVFRRAETMLKGKLQLAWKAGQQEVAQSLRQLGTEKLKQEISSKKRDQQQKEKKQKQIASKKTEVTARKKSLKLTTEQWKSWLDRQTEAAQSDLKKIVGELSLLEQRRQTIARAILLSRQEQSNLLAFLKLRSIQQRPSLQQRQQIEALLAQLQQDILKYQLQDLKTWQQMQRLRASGAAIWNRYRQARQQFEQATGEIARQNAALERLSGQLKKQERSLQQKSPNHLRAVVQMKNLQQRFSTYVPFDLQKEKQHLLDSLKNDSLKNN